MWGSRIVIPPPGRETVLHELHEGHPGITHMKSLARMYVWWPGISADIDALNVSKCNPHLHLHHCIHESGLLDLGQGFILILLDPSKAKTFSLLLMLTPNRLKLFAPHPLPLPMSLRSSGHCLLILDCWRW